VIERVVAGYIPLGLAEKEWLKIIMSMWWVKDLATGFVHLSF
jgi:hypothetical protein